jgi:cell cycle checkpoint protein
MKKILKEIARKECLFLPASKLEEFVDESDGDIRLAINSLQFRSIPIDDTFVEEKPPPAPVRRAKKDGAKIVEFDDHVGHLSLFHAVGKVLYAKRDAHGNYESTPEVSFSPSFV